MRVDVTPLSLAVSPGISQTVTVTISNTETIIAGYAIRVLGADPGWIELQTDTMALFPDETRALTVDIRPPGGLPAGSRRLAIQVRETTPPFASLVTELDLTVPAAPLVQLRVDPLAVTAGKRATFSLLVENTGNTTMKGFLAADDPENIVRFAFEPELIELAPGQHSVVDMRAWSKRPFFGTPTVRTLSVYLDPLRADAFFTPNMPPPVEATEREPLAGATFIQKSVMARGALSLLGLLFAATVFAVVITLALSRLVAQSTSDRNLALQVAAARNSAATTGTSGMSGTATLLTSGAAAPGVTVSVFSAANTSAAVATTATNKQGGYSFTDLPAGQYKLNFRGSGFELTWYAGSASAANATTITLAAAQVRSGLNVSLGGVPASLSGTITGDDVSAATLFLESLPSGTTAPASSSGHLLTSSSSSSTPSPPDNGGAVVQTVPIGSDGTFSLNDVPSPSVYDLVVAKTGYTTSTQRIDVAAGENRKNISLELVQGNGLLAGMITTASGPLGGATVTATAGQESANTVSLTRTGAFTLRGLPTPASITLVATKNGYASQTLTVNLASGQKLNGVSITLDKSAASLTGKVTIANGHGTDNDSDLGGVGVTVTNGLLTIDTVTASTGNIGSWQVGGLAIPGTYTVTFARSDLASQTVSVSLDASGTITPGSYGARVNSTGLVVQMQSATGAVAGRITQPGGETVAQAGGTKTSCDDTNGLGEAQVTLSSGESSYTVTSASIDPNCGRYRFEQVPPGTYTLSVDAGSGTTPSSSVITVTAGQTFNGRVKLLAAASISGTVTKKTTTTKPNGTGSTTTTTVGPAAGETVFLYLESDYPSTVAQQTTTDSKGNYLFSHVDAGRYIIAVGPTSDPASATNTEPATVQPSLPRTHVNIRVTQ